MDYTSINCRRFIHLLHHYCCKPSHHSSSYHRIIIWSSTQDSRSDWGYTMITIITLCHNSIWSAVWALSTKSEHWALIGSCYCDTFSHCSSDTELRSCCTLSASVRSSLIIWEATRLIILSLCAVCLFCCDSMSSSCWWRLDLCKINKNKQNRFKKN